MNRHLRHLRHLSIAVASGALLAFAGSVVADVPNDGYAITDQKESVTRGYIVVAGDTFLVQAYTVCAPMAGGDSPDGSVVFFLSEHPDGAKLKNEKGSVEQSQKDNPARLFIQTGSGLAFRQNDLSCEEIEVSAEIKTKKTPLKGSFQGKAKNCVCDDSGENDCDSYAAQIAQLAEDCGNLQSIKGKFDGGVVKKVSIKGKGDAEQARG